MKIDNIVYKMVNLDNRAAVQYLKICKQHNDINFEYYKVTGISHVVIYTNVGMT